MNIIWPFVLSFCLVFAIFEMFNVSAQSNLEESLKQISKRKRRSAPQNLEQSLQTLQEKRKRREVNSGPDAESNMDSAQSNEDEDHEENEHNKSKEKNGNDTSKEKDGNDKSQETETRVKRLVTNLKPNDVKLWKSPINYTFDAKLPESLKKEVNSALDNLSNRTCLEFKESTEGDHIVFVNDNNAKCSSQIGRQGGEQKIALAEGSNGCKSLSLVTHEIFHALGFRHEMNRPDAYKNIKVNKEHVPVSLQGQFQTVQSVNTDAPYDLQSVNQYNDKFPQPKNKNTRITEVNDKKKGQEYALNPVTKTYAPLSYYDIKIVNQVYGCGGKCKNPKCQNQGFKAGKECKCQCPKEVTGDDCEKLDAEYGEIRKEDSGIIDSGKMIQKMGKVGNKVKRAAWLIPATHEEVVHLSFCNGLYVDELSNNYIEIRGKAITLAGYRMYGATDTRDMVYTAVGPGYIEMALKNTAAVGVGFKVGFSRLSLTKFQECKKKKEFKCFNCGILKSDCSCQCQDGYTGDRCEKFTNKACEGKKSCENGGKLDMKSEGCPCVCPSVDGPGVNITGELCEHFGYCHQRLDKKVLKLMAYMNQKPAEDEVFCAGKTKSMCDITVKSRCPIMCQTSCDCIDYMDKLQANSCGPKSAGCKSEKKAQKDFMNVFCQKTCDNCPVD